MQHEPYTELLLALQRVAAVEGPLHVEVMVDRSRERCGLGKVRGGTREHVYQAITRAVREGRLVRDGDFVAASTEQFSRKPRRGVGDNPRDIEHIHVSELRSAVIATRHLMYGGNEEDLIVEAARQLGFRRTGSAIYERLREVIRTLTRDGNL